MKFRALLPVLFSLLLASCGVAPQHTSIAEQNQNPFTASRYGDELADTLANLIITSDPILKEKNVESLVQSEIERAKVLVSDARERLDEGMNGSWIRVNQSSEGFVSFLEDHLYFSSDFFTDPGPSLHVYLTTIVDPRGVAFPDETAIDLGEIQSAYGAQTYDVPQSESQLYRTAVLYDMKLKRLYSFSQLSRRSQ